MRPVIAVVRRVDDPLWYPIAQVEHCRGMALVQIVWCCEVSKADRDAMLVALVTGGRTNHVSPGPLPKLP